MRVLLVLAPEWTVETPPLAIASLAAWLEQHGHTTRCLDLNLRAYRESPDHQARRLWDLHSQSQWLDEQGKKTCSLLWPILSRGLEEAVEDFAPEIVGFSLFATNLATSMALAEHAKKLRPELPVVFGGPPCHSDAEDGGQSYFLCFDPIDAVVKVEGEMALTALVEDLAANGRLTRAVPGSIVRLGGAHVHGGEGDKVARLDALPLPLFRDLPPGNYLRKALPIQGSRGCVARCTYCAEAGWWGQYRYKTPARVVDEMRDGMERYGVRSFVFVDSLINGSLPKLREMASEIVRQGLDVEFEGNARVHPQMDAEMFALLKRAGCRQLKLGIESGSDEVLRAMKKGTRTADAMQVLRHAKHVGIEASTDWLVGYPTETWRNYLETLWFIAKHRDYLGVVNANPDGAAVLPGARLHSNPEKWSVDDLRSHSDWSGPGGMNSRRVRRLKGHFFKRWVRWMGIHQAN